MHLLDTILEIDNDNEFNCIITIFYYVIIYIYIIQLALNDIRFKKRTRRSFPLPHGVNISNTHWSKTNAWNYIK